MTAPGGGCTPTGTLPGTAAAEVAHGGGQGGGQGTATGDALTTAGRLQHDLQPDTPRVPIRTSPAQTRRMFMEVSPSPGK